MKTQTNLGSKSLVLLLAFLMASTASAQTATSARLDGGVVSGDWFGFYWETRLQPGTPPMSAAVTTDSYFTTTNAANGGIIHRILLDSSRRIYMGYDAVVQRLQEPNTYQVTFRRLTMSPAKAKEYLGDDPSSWTLVATPGWEMATPRKVYAGEILVLPLLTNAATGQTVRDYVTVQEPSRKIAGFQQLPEREFTFEPGPTRDFRTEDAQMTLQSTRLSINGKLDPTSTGRYDDVQGAIVWFYVGGRGRFLLSLTPRPDFGFRKAGEVRGSSLSFAIGPDTFVLNTGERIAPGEGPFSVYVLHEPGWKPTHRDADLTAFITGAADRVETLLGR